MAQYLGLTWDHPRGFQALEAAAEDTQNLIKWDRQPLSGFETASIDGLFARYDVVVIDHPHLGEALANKCIQPLDKLFDSNIVEKWKNRSIGNSFESYRMNGHLWALPLDAATQVMAYQSERVDSPPSTWDEVREVSRKTGRVSLSLQGPHAILTALSINSALGNELGAETLFGACTEVIFDLMVDLYAHRPSGS